jgi:hypothetical protein
MLPKDPDVVLFVWALREIAALSVRIKQIASQNPELTFLTILEGAAPKGYDDRVDLQNPRMIDLVERLRMVIAKRRGPKPKCIERDAKGEQTAAA